SVSYWDLPSRHCLRRLLLGENAGCEHLAISLDARLLATSIGGRARVLWAASGRALADWTPHAGADVQDLAFASDGSRLATVGESGVVRTWMMPTPRGGRR